MLNNNLKLYFKQTVQSGGARLYQKGVVSFLQPSDTEIVAYVKPSASFKVILKSSSLNDENIFASCTCAIADKGQLCQHIWATLLAISEKSVDFLENKSIIQLKQPEVSSKSQLKEKQAAFRKQQYQKQKQRIKDQKKAKKQSSTVSSFPEEVEFALQFFSENGFPIRESLTKDSIRLAKIKLARVFHPDLGGSHQEILELNRCAEILSQFSKLK